MYVSVIGIVYYCSENICQFLKDAGGESQAFHPWKSTAKSAIENRHCGWRVDGDLSEFRVEIQTPNGVEPETQSDQALKSW
jgi:hypothetical protein